MTASRKSGDDASSPSGEGRYRIQVVAEKTGVPAATLRAWERRYGIPTPARTEASYRLYSDRDVALVRALNQHCASGMAPAEAARRVRESVAAEQGVAPDDPFREIVGALLDAVTRFDPDALERLIAQAMMLGSASAIFERVVSPVQLAIGERWHAGELSVGQEHFASEALGAAMHALHRLVQPLEAEKTAVLACLASEEHTLPLYGAAFRLASWGYRTVLLGARTPPSALRDAREALAPDLIGLSVTVPPPGELWILMREYGDACAPVPWVVGGRGTRVMAEAIAAAGGVALPHGELTASALKMGQLIARRKR